MAASRFSVDAERAMREIWPQNELYRAWLEDQPMLGLIPKATDFHEPVRHLKMSQSPNQGIGGTYAGAKKNSTANTYVQFDVAPRIMYGRASADGRLFRRAKAANNKAEIIKHLGEISKGLVQVFNNEAARYIFGDGSGRLGTVHASVALGTANLRLTDSYDLRVFDIGFPVQFVNPATGVARVMAVDAKVVSVNEQTNTLVLNGNISTLCPTAAAGDYVIREGMSGAVPQGMAAWNPVYTGPSDLTTPFNGVTRSVFPSRLAGNVLDVATSGLTDPRAIVMRATIQNRNHRGKAKHLFLNPERWNDFADSLLAKVVHTKTPAASIGKIAVGIEYDGIQFTGAGGVITVYADPACPINIGRLVQLDAWKYATSGPLVYWDVGEGEWRLENDADEREVRLVSDGNIQCEAPYTSTTIVYPAYT